MAEHDAPAHSDTEPGATGAAPRRGALNIVTIIAMAVAVLALGLAGVLFMQLSKANGALKHAALPEGLKEGEGEPSEEHGKEVASMTSEPSEVTFELGDFTTNSKDGKFVKLSLALAVRSFYLKDDWDNYQFEQQQYADQRKAYFDFLKQSAEGGEKKAVLPEPPTQAPVTTLAVYRPGNGSGIVVIPAEEHKKEAAPALPEKEPVRPLTRLEQAMTDDNSKVRNVINNEINNTNASDLISSEGKAEFKKRVMEALGKAFDSALGTVEDIYFKNLVTT